MNVFMAGQDQVRWDVTSLGPEGPYRLAVHHPAGSIVEYFPSVSAALTRERQLEDLLTVDHSMAAPTSEMVL
jgi:hypothetical protein